MFDSLVMIRTEKHDVLLELTHKCVKSTHYVFLTWLILQSSVYFRNALAFRSLHDGYNRTQNFAQRKRENLRTGRFMDYMDACLYCNTGILTFRQLLSTRKLYYRKDYRAMRRKSKQTTNSHTST